MTPLATGFILGCLVMAAIVSGVVLATSSINSIEEEEKRP